MGEATVAPAQRRDDEAARAAEAAAAKAAAAVEAFARDHEGLTDEDEQDALDFLLAPKPPGVFDVKVEMETDVGPKKLTFMVRPMDGRRLDVIETQHRSETTGQLDQITADCTIISEACVGLEGRKGHVETLASETFLTVPQRDPRTGDWGTFKHLSPADALEARFKTQTGLLMGVAREIRSISGFDMTKVSSAKRRTTGIDVQRRLADAAGNSSGAGD